MRRKAPSGATPFVVILSLYFLSLSLLPLFSSVFAASDGTYQVVFEEVGQVATSVTYLHLAIDLDLPELSDAVDDYREIMDETFRSATALQLGFGYPDWDAVLANFTKGFQSLQLQFRTRYLMMKKRLDHLMEILPHSAETREHKYETDDVRFRRHTRTKRALPLIIMKGVVGTLVGLYNRRQTGRLRQDLDTTIKWQRRLMATTIEHSKEIRHLQTYYSYLPGLVEKTSFIQPLMVVARFLEIEAKLEKEIQRATAAIQEAQHRRLSISLLNGTRLVSAFERIKDRARELRLDLLIERPSDLFQIEVSYFYDGKDVSLLLHIPMAAPNSLLRLQRFLPFPLSFTDHHFLLPNPSRRLFAISSSEQRLSLELDEADLEGCYRLNTLHLCERLGILSSKIDHTCLGALYNQNFEKATELCHMEVVNSTEKVLQLDGNRYLVYATHSFTAPISCRNLTANEIHFKTGVNQIQLSPSCMLSLQDHVIFADSALQTTNLVKMITWNPNEMEMTQEEKEEAVESIAAAAEDGHVNPSLTNLRQRSGHRRRWIGWIAFLVLTGGLIALAVMYGAPALVYIRKFLVLKKIVKTLRDQIAGLVARLAHDRLGALGTLSRSAQERLVRLASAPPPPPPDRTSSARPGPSRPAGAALPIETEYTDAEDYLPRPSARPGSTPGVQRRASQRRRQRVSGGLLHRGRLLGQRELGRLLLRLRNDRPSASED